jgi:hypothetical protein
VGIFEGPPIKPDYAASKPPPFEIRKGWGTRGTFFPFNIPLRQNMLQSAEELFRELDCVRQ